ncbi:hypothetical protein GPECTOR_13g813 [Gonium pectorale]|uniref:SET domain-containing protein n=1 Tax=Gonium pectorale TaxID=33097 RepID=A0A150GN84_GONPE|nr:hypothetical protein GPECTOR_13g813 [Gonium pectorale]|eukprot:KXZ51326.1 hypothetical protein GPECTOR_13g813 [Gonium pectorale]
MIAEIAKHPLGGAAFNLSAAAVRGFARLLVGAPLSGSGGPTLCEYYPLANATGGDCSSPETIAVSLDWADPRVWAAQQDSVKLQGPFYEPEDIASLMPWCSLNASLAAFADQLKDLRADTAGEEEAAIAAQRFRRLAEWVALNGGDTSRVALGVDASGARGLHALGDIPAGEIALAVPLRLGLSIATFRAGRAAAGPTADFARVEDADLLLDALALSYEVAVHGERSPWADHLCLLPRRFGGLPVHASDPDAAALLSPLPNLRRLAAKRRALLQLVGERLAAPALTALPGGRTAMAKLRGVGATAGGGGGAGGGAGNATRKGDLWPSLWHWAVAATKTRSVSMGTEEMRESGGAGAPGEGGLPVRLPLAMLQWVKEMGLVLPLFDLANHAFEGEGSNVAYQLLPAPWGGGLAACLLASTDIRAGQPLLFDYMASAEAEAGPSCADRWLLEYGFVPETADPRRDCDTFHVSAAELAAAVAAAEADEGVVEARLQVSELEARIRARLARMQDDGLPGRFEIEVRHPDPYEAEIADPSHAEHVRQRWAAVHWLTEALRDDGADSAGGGVAGTASTTFVDADAVLRALLSARRKQLAALEGAAQTRKGDGSKGDLELRRGVAAVAAAARRAVDRALEQEQERARGRG